MAAGPAEQEEAAGGEAAPASAGAPAACAPGSPLPWEGLAEEALRGALASAHTALSQLEHVDAPGLVMAAAAAAAAARPAKRGRLAGGGGAAAADMALLRCARCHAGAALWERDPRQETLPATQNLIKHGGSPASFTRHHHAMRSAGCEPAGALTHARAARQRGGRACGRRRRAGHGRGAAAGLARGRAAARGGLRAGRGAGALGRARACRGVRRCARWPQGVGSPDQAPALSSAAALRRAFVAPGPQGVRAACAVCRGVLHMPGSASDSW